MSAFAHYNISWGDISMGEYRHVREGKDTGQSIYVLLARVTEGQ
jgi:hypothetical protein